MSTVFCEVAYSAAAVHEKMQRKGRRTIKTSVRRREVRYRQKRRGAKQHSHGGGKNVRSGRAKRTSMTGAAVGMPETVRKGGAGAVGRAENRARMRYARI